MIMGEDGSANLADNVVAAIQESATGAATMLSWGIPADNPSVVSETALERLLEGAEWAPQHRLTKSLDRTQVGLGTLLRNWALFQLQVPLLATKSILGFGRVVVEQTVTAATVGRSASEVGRVRPLSPEQASQVAERRIKEVSDELSPANLREEAASWGQTTPTAWRELRELSIGLADGSALPARFMRVARGGFDEVLPPAYVVPHPDSRPPTGASVGAGGLDIGSILELHETLAASDPDDGPATEPSEQDTDVAEESTPKQPTDLEALESWIAEREASLLWRLAMRVHDFRRRETEQAYRAHEVLVGTRPPATGRLKNAQIAVIVCWLLTLGGLIFVGLVAWERYRTDPWWVIALLPNLNWNVLAALVAPVVLALLVAGTVYFQALRAFEWQVAQRMHQIREAGDEHVAASQQAHRWHLMYDGIQDWGHVLGELLHRPWAVNRDLDIPARPEYAGLPAAVAVAEPVNRAAGPEPRVVSSVVEAVCQRGWLTEEFHRLLALSPLNDPTVHGSAGDLPADLDLGLRPLGPRSELAYVAALRDTKDSARTHLIETVTQLIDRSDIALPNQKVVRVGPHSSGEEMVGQSYLVESNDVQSPLAIDLFSPEALVSRANHPEYVVFNLPSGFPAPQVHNAEVHRSGRSVVVRVDVTPSMPARSVRLFVPSKAQPAYVAPAVDDFN
jgi:hypothetical protein